jgi:hypothetical protein
MGLGQYHGDRAFEAFLRTRRMPYVSVNEARRTLVAPDAMGVADLKSFDFVVYTAAASAVGANLLVDVKCRRLPTPRLRLVDADGVRRPARAGRAVRLESWATAEDVRSLRAWQSLFGPGFRAAFMFVYWCESTAEGGATQPPDGLFDEVFMHEGRWYAVRGVLLDDYEPAMQVRSARWETVDLPPARFERLSEGFGRAWLGGRTGVGTLGNQPAQAAAGR